MGKVIIHEEVFPEIVERYNSGGRTEAYDFLRSRYGIKHPYFVINRIRECGKYNYDPETDRFDTGEATVADDVFMNLDELCAGTAVKPAQQAPPDVGSRPEAMEKLVRELISDRLLTLSKYVALDTSTRTILIDRTSMTADGYNIVTH